MIIRRSRRLGKIDGHQPPLEIYFMNNFLGGWNKNFIASSAHYIDVVTPGLNDLL
jgi:hypothetical protein